MRKIIKKKDLSLRSDLGELDERDHGEPSALAIPKFDLLPVGAPLTPVRS
jgi:hypothetical protein